MQFLFFITVGRGIVILDIGGHYADAICLEFASESHAPIPPRPSK
jgi:hypothetical protein